MSMVQADLKARGNAPGGQTVHPFGVKDQIGYLLGDFGNDFSFIFIMAFVRVYYTDVLGIIAAAVGTLFFVSRFIDAFADVIWGRFIDSQKTTKLGKYKPWILRMSLPLVISFILLYVPLPDMSDGFYLAWAYVTYIVWGLLYTTVNIPYGSMASVISGNSLHRTSLSTWRTMGATLAALIINVLGPLIVFVDNQMSANRLFMTAVVFGVLAMACYFGCVRFTTERIVLPEKTAEQKGNMAKTLKGLLRNKPLLWMLASSLLFLITTMLISSVNVYLFKDYFSNATALSIVGFIQAGTVILAMPLIQPLVKRFGKKETASIGVLLASAFYFVMYFIPNIPLSLFLVLISFAMFGFGIFNLIIWALVTDVIDYHEYLTGLREDATVYSVYSFARKLGQAVAGGVGGFAIAAIGYVSGLDRQPQEVLDGIYMIATLIPAVTFLLVFLILTFFYPLNKKRVYELTITLEERRSVKN